MWCINSEERKYTHPSRNMVHHLKEGNELYPSKGQYDHSSVERREHKHILTWRD